MKLWGFLAETATEVRARIVLNQNTGTVRKGGLWNEENLPAEAVLWGISLSRNPTISRVRAQRKTHSKMPFPMLRHCCNLAAMPE